jgi:hypothetical protein
MEPKSMRRNEHEFKDEVRRCVCRGTKSAKHESTLKEIFAHFDDLMAEALSQGATVEEARKQAGEKMGSISDIAKAIRSSSAGPNGTRLQWIAMAIFVFGALIPRVMGMNGYEIGSLWGRIIEACDPIGLIAIYVAGFLAAFGILKSKRVAVLGFCLAVALISGCHTAILLRHSRSFSVYDSRIKVYNDSWQQYAGKYRPILTERYNLYVASISGTQQKSDEAIKKLSASVHRPQDRGAVILDGEKGKWIYPLKAEAVRARNIRVFPFRGDNLNWVHFGATDSFEVAQKEWRSADELFNAIPILRKGSEAEFAITSQKIGTSALWTILSYVKIGVIHFLYSFVLSFLLFGIATKLRQLVKGNRRAL